MKRTIEDAVIFDTISILLKGDPDDNLLEQKGALENGT